MRVSCEYEPWWFLKFCFACAIFKQATNRTAVFLGNRTEKALDLPRPLGYVLVAHPLCLFRTATFSLGFLIAQPMRTSGDTSGNALGRCSEIIWVFPGEFPIVQK